MLPVEEIKKASLKRKKTYTFFDKNNVKYAAKNLSKPYINQLSPGCLTCVKGTWSCLYINGLCTRNCFFCSQDRKISKERLPESYNLIFNKPEEYISYLKMFDFEGIGFSGGETFLVFDKLLDYTKKIRETFGSKHYIWLYTNGDLITKEKLKKLKEAGLNEIRFDLSARNYDLKPVKLAVKYIKTVTIEIPAIPEDLEIVKSLLSKLELIGVKYLNLHQLSATKHNYKEMVKRNYTCLYGNSKYARILESEFTAFEILKYAIKIKSKLGLNYCNFCYKQRFQISAFRKRIASLLKEDPNSITKIGYLRNLFMQCSKKEFDKISKILKNKKKMLKTSSKNEANQYELFIKPENLKILIDNKNKFDNIKLKIIYLDYIFKNSKKCSGINKYKKNFKKRKIGKIILGNNLSMTVFQKLFIENKDIKQVSNELAISNKLNSSEKNKILEDIKQFYDTFKSVEYSPKELPDYC